MKVVVSISPRDYDAMQFDHGGVQRRNVSVHATTWKNAADIGRQQDATGDAP